MAAVRRLEPLRPAFVSVTYGAGGSHRDRTIRVTERIAEETTLLPVAHLTAVGHSVAELRQVIGSYASVGVQQHPGAARRSARRPDGGMGRAPAGPGVRQRAGVARPVARRLLVGVAAYPDKHPRSPDLESDTRFLAEKINAGADYAITQMLFSADDYLRATRPDGPRPAPAVPLLPGIMPITSYARLMRIHELSGQRMPADLAARLLGRRGRPGRRRGRSAWSTRSG